MWAVSNIGDSIRGSTKGLVLPLHLVQSTYVSSGKQRPKSHRTLHHGSGYLLFSAHDDSFGRSVQLFPFSFWPRCTIDCSELTIESAFTVCIQQSNLHLWNVNPLSLHWCCLSCWVFPPFSLLCRVLFPAFPDLPPNYEETVAETHREWCSGKTAPSQLHWPVSSPDL